MGAYTRFEQEKKEWFMRLIEGMVTRPQNANFGRVRGGLDLELAIFAAPEDEAVFTPEVCRALQTVVAAAVGGIVSPVIYLQGKPHPEAREALDYAASRV